MRNAYTCNGSQTQIIIKAMSFSIGHYNLYCINTQLSNTVIVNYRYDHITYKKVKLLTTVMNVHIHRYKKINEDNTSHLSNILQHRIITTILQHRTFKVF